MIANNILGGAGAGLMVGLSAGTLAYGLDNNYNPDYLLTGAVYGFLTGAVLGTGIGIYEISTDRQDTGFTFSEYTVGGTGIGAMLGLVIATLPYMRDKDPEDFTIGIGLGGLVGATFGIGFAVWDINSRSAGKDDLLLSGRIGIEPEYDYVPVSGPGETRAPLVLCRMATLTFK
ncbi:MAG: hypothetical protein AB1439_06335 [candidate division FCPU426 bacterium]